MTLRAAIVDMDGTVVRGDALIPGADDGLRRLREAGLSLLLLSNNPTRGPAYYGEKLGRFGIDVADEEVVTAAEVTAAYLAEYHPDDRLFVVGHPRLVDVLASRGLTVTDDPDAADAVLASYDPEFDYDDMTRALRALERDSVALLGTDPDVTIPAEDREVPGSGAVLNAVAGVADRDPDLVLGKPAPFTRELALDRLGVAPEECVVVGDRLDTDLALGADAGMTTVLVLSGIADRDDLAASDTEPDHVLDSLADVGDVL